MLHIQLYHVLLLVLILLYWMALGSLKHSALSLQQLLLVGLVQQLMLGQQLWRKALLHTMHLQSSVLGSYTIEALK